jgi:glycosyltransferase involved in cell wall biosynthesis
MRILIDLQSCQGGSRNGGIGRYSMSLAKAMIECGGQHDFFLLLNGRLLYENEIRHSFSEHLPQDRILKFEAPRYVAAENNLPGHTAMAELVRESRIADIDPDVVHVSSLFEGAGEDVVTSVGNIFPGDRTAVTLYDLIPYVERKIYLQNPAIEAHYMKRIGYLKSAGAIFSISEFSRLEAIDLLQLDPGKTHNISSAADGQFVQTLISDDERAALCSRYGISRNFLLFTASFDPRKNHARLVEAFSRIPAHLRASYQLVIVGRGEAHQYASLRELAARLGLTQDELVFVGRVEDDDLVSLYSVCALFVFPSLREGFGLPVLEAMSCGAPTIGSATTSIPEVIGRTDALFDPENVNAMTDLFVRCLESPPYRAALSESGLQQAKNFSWELSAHRALSFLESKFTSKGTPKRPDITNSLAEIRATGGSLQQTLSDKFLGCAANVRHHFEIEDELLSGTARSLAANELHLKLDAADVNMELRVAWILASLNDHGTSLLVESLAVSLKSSPTLFLPVGHPEVSVSGASVARCWRPSSPDLAALESELRHTRADCIMIVYEPSVMDLTAFTSLIEQQRERGRSVGICLGDVASNLFVDSTEAIAHFRAVFRSFDCIFVLTMDDWRFFHARKVKKNVHLVPAWRGPQESAQTVSSRFYEVTGWDTALMRKKLLFAHYGGDALRTI